MAETSEHIHETWNNAQVLGLFIMIEASPLFPQSDLIAPSLSHSHCLSHLSPSPLQTKAV